MTMRVEGSFYYKWVQSMFECDWVIVRLGFYQKNYSFMAQYCDFMQYMHVSDHDRDDG